MTKRAPEELGLLRSIAATKYAPLVGPAPAILNNLVHDNLLKWSWNGGIPIYELTDDGLRALDEGEKR